jgi:hypothetical protein
MGSGAAPPRRPGKGVVLVIYLIRRFIRWLKMRRTR